MDAFEAGGSFTVNDGIGSGWYIVPPVAVNGLGGDDQRVLVATVDDGRRFERSVPHAGLPAG